MKTSEKGKGLIKSSEGLRLEAYGDTGGVLTIGYGHTGGVKKGQKVSREEAGYLLDRDILSAEREVEKRVKVPLTQGQFDALVDFVFNLGGGQFGSSTLLKRINAGASDGEICAQFRRWVYDNGRVLPGLQKRREEECKLWMS